MTKSDVVIIKNRSKRDKAKEYASKIKLPRIGRDYDDEDSDASQQELE